MLFIKLINLSQTEKVLESDILKLGGSKVRNMIWSFVQNDQPIPNELKPSLLAILNEEFKGVSTEITAAKRRILVMEVVFSTLGVYTDVNNAVVQDKEKCMTRDDAIVQVANLHGVTVDRLEREYKSSKYRKLKDALKQGWGAK